MEDETIVELLYRRDEGALEELEGKYGPGLLRLAGRFLKSREDVEGIPIITKNSYFALLFSCRL